ncbi:MAG TPA: L-threonylcarbamoyladenylate synthase [Paenalcaligenes sp.]|nr:L-threonylcarbamoyladenylate synthase [Paenalcaligenes sp.]
MTVVRGNDIQEAARWLTEGRLVAFPTETVYGLGANAHDEQAIAAVYKAKGRPGNHPVIVHVADAAAATTWAEVINEPARLLMEHFWPGPLTLILPRAEHVSLHITGGQDTVAVRCPEHPLALQLLQAFEQLHGPGAGVIAPSANRFGQVSPTHADHVYDEFSDLKDVSIYLLEGGEARVGIESTIVDLSNPDAPPRILRPGHIQASDIQRVLGGTVLAPEPNTLAAASKPHSDVPRVSGSLKAHYAPRTPLYLFQRSELNTWLKNNQNKRVAIVSCGPLDEAAQKEHLAQEQTPASLDEPQLHHEVLPAEPTQYASVLYATLRRLDSCGFEALWFEYPPQDTVWAGVNDRLGRAAAAFSAAD